MSLWRVEGQLYFFLFCFSVQGKKRNTSLGYKVRPSVCLRQCRISRPWGSYITPCTRVLLQTVRVPQLVKKVPAFHGDRKLASPQEPAIFPNPEPDQSSLRYPSYFLKINFNIISHRSQGLTNGLFRSGFPTKPLYVPLHPPSHLSWFDSWRISGEHNRSCSLHWTIVWYFCRNECPIGMYERVHDFRICILI
jgi:hypothetical protein